MAVPTWSVGQVLAAADVNSWMVPLAAFKAADTSRPSTTTVAADPDLAVSVAASATYQFWSFLSYEGAAYGTADLKLDWAVPTGATLRYGILTGLPLSSNSYTQFSLTLAAQAGAATVVAVGTNGTGNAAPLLMFGTLITSTTAGSLALQWSQNTSSATATVVHTGSAVVLNRIG